MVLVVVFIFLTYTLGTIRISFLDHFTFLSTRAHQFCLNLLPANPQTEPALQALVCGHNFESLETSQLYLSSGLIHLFVVSGSHLILAEKVLGSVFKIWPLKYSSTLIICCLFMFCIVCELNPPVVRSFLGICLGLYLARKHRHWPRDYTILITGLLCVSLKPEWTMSLGLQMSWLAALAIHINERLLSSRPKLLHQLTFYILFIFSFSCLGFPAFTALLTCYFFSPVLEFILLPLAFLTIPFPTVDLIFEKSIQCLDFLLAHMELSTSLILSDVQETLVINWFVIFCLHLALHFRPSKT
jgi:predicted membrane metal-binding protein